MKNKLRGQWPIFILSFLFLLILSCENGEDYPEYDPPADHKISKEGVMHKSGLSDPLVNCVACHGADLEGGNTGVSCYECHGTEWD